MPKWTDKPWERQKGESAQAYEAFVTYRDMGSDRSIRAVGQRLDKSRTQIGKWSSAWNWQERVRAYDNELEKEARAKAVKDRKAMTERHIGIAMQLQKKALEALIRRLPNADRRLVLRLRYLDSEEWEDVLFIAYGGKPDFNEKYDNYKQRVFRHHKQALAELEAISGNE